MAQTIAYAGRMPDRGTLDERYYMQSVLKHGYMAGILSDGDLASVSDQLMELLAQKAGELTDGSSSSISVETAGELMSSMTFVTGVRLKEYERSEHAAEAVRDRSLTDPVSYTHLDVYKRQEDITIRNRYGVNFTFQVFNYKLGYSLSLIHISDVPLSYLCGSDSSWRNYGGQVYGEYAV